MHLAITTRWNGDVVDSALIEVVGPVVLGDAPDAVVSFPGVAVPVSLAQQGEGIVIGGRLLRSGDCQLLQFGEIELDLRVERPVRLQRDRLVAGDPALLVLTGAMIVFGLWWETVDRWAHTNPTVVAELEALPSMWSRIQGEAEPEPASTSDYPPEVRFQE